MVHHELHHFPLDGVEYFFIENVGNLVCPAVYDLGQAANVVCLSVTEGEDKPLKYPTMFAKADVVLLTKTDLLPHLSVDVGAIYDALARVMPNRVVFTDVPAWIEWLKERRAAMAPVEVMA
jgi:hydrogenase nickel incorporation protein HypB